MSDLSQTSDVLLGFGFHVDGFYLHSFEIFLACTVVFPGIVCPRSIRGKCF